MNFASPWNKLFKLCISVDFLLMEVCLCTGCSAKGATHCFFRRALQNSYFGKALLMNFASFGRSFTGRSTKGAAS